MNRYYEFIIIVNRYYEAVMDRNSVSAKTEMQNSKEEKDNVLAAYHTLRFSKEDKDCFDIADIERKSLGVKYMTTKLL